MSSPITSADRSSRRTRPGPWVTPRARDADPTQGQSDGHHAVAVFVGECVDTKHPTLTGRVQVRWEDPDGRTRDNWLPCLHGLAVRTGDRLLVQQPQNWREPIVVGVVDGFAMRPKTEYRDGPTLSLRPDESVRIDTSEGKPVAEIIQEEHGPVVRLLDDDVNLDLNGRLRVNAKSIDLTAEKGGVNIKANDDVVVEGEVIKLN